MGCRQTGSINLPLAPLRRGVNAPLAHSTMKDDPRWQRRHGLHRPLDPLQILSWVLFGFFAATFYSLVVPWFRQPTSIVVGVMYGVLLLWTGVLDVVTAYTNPAPRQAEMTPVATSPRIDPTRWCYQCQTTKHPDTKHCRLCNKCVEGFDHHCKWLNNCVGIRNYRRFIQLLVAVALLISLQLILSIVLIVEYGLDRSGKFREYVQDSYPSMSEGLFFGIIVVVSVVALGTLAMVFQLLAFHFRLMMRGITTLDWLSGIRSMQDKIELQAAREATRMRPSNGPPSRRLAVRPASAHELQSAVAENSPTAPASHRSTLTGSGGAPGKAAAAVTVEVASYADRAEDDVAETQDPDAAGGQSDPGRSRASDEGDSYEEAGGGRTADGSQGFNGVVATSASHHGEHDAPSPSASRSPRDRCQMYSMSAEEGVEADNLSSEGGGHSGVDSDEDSDDGGGSGVARPASASGSTTQRVVALGRHASPMEASPSQNDLSEATATYV